MTPAAPSGVVTFLFTDVEGSTRRWETDADGMRMALAAHDEVLRSAIEAHDGFLFSHSGDGVVAAFALPRSAVDAAIAAQWALELPVRMGLATGEARDLMLAIGYPSATACAFPAIIDTAVAVATVMLVALGDKPARRTRAATMHTSAHSPVVKRAARSANPQVMPRRFVQDAGPGGASRPGKGVASVQLDLAKTVRSAQAEAAQDDADLASDLIASGVTTQSLDTVIAVLSAHGSGASINAAAKASGINYRTAQRIVAAAERRQRGLVAVG